MFGDVGNRKKLVSAMQRIKFISVSYYSKAIEELFINSKHTFSLLVYKDQNQRYVFRGLYEVCEKDPKINYKLFAPNYVQNNKSINNINIFIIIQLIEENFSDINLIKIKIKNLMKIQ